MQSVIFPNGRCRLHGGKTPRGSDSPSFKTGKYSAYLPPHIAFAYETQRADPDLMSCRDTLALVDSLIQHRLREIYDGFPPDAWGRAMDLYQQYLDTRPGEADFDDQGHVDQERSDPNVPLKALGDLLTKGRLVANAFELIEPMLESHRKQVEAEFKRLKFLDTHMDVAEARTHAIRLARCVKDHVKDPEILRLIQADMSKIVSLQGDEAT